MLCKASNCSWGQAGKLFDCRLPIGSETIGESGKCTEFRKKHDQRIVYICTPDDDQVKTQKLYEKAIEDGCVPIIPQIVCPKINTFPSENEVELRLKIAMLLLSCCDEIWMASSVPVEDGMVGIIEEANRIEIVIRKRNAG